MLDGITVVLYLEGEVIICLGFLGWTTIHRYVLLQVHLLGSSSPMDKRKSVCYSILLNLETNISSNSSGVFGPHSTSN